jgi:hypothetical protein
MIDDKSVMQANLIRLQIIEGLMEDVVYGDKYGVPKKEFLRIRRYTMDSVDKMQKRLLRPVLPQLDP